MLKKLCYGLIFLFSTNAFADDVDLAKELTNPIAHLISVPFQFNHDTKINTDNTGNQTYLNFQPVIPVNLNSHWTVISRTIVTVIDQYNIVPRSGKQFGLGDTLQSFFF